MAIEAGMPVAALLLTTLAICFVGGVFPLVNAEIFTLGAALLVPPEHALVLVPAAAAGQMVGKLLWYLAARGVVHLPLGSLGPRLDAVQARLAGRHATGGALIFVSAATSLPPFHLTAFASGALRLHLGVFLLAGFGGRLVRFAALAAFPQIARVALA